MNTNLTMWLCRECDWWTIRRGDDSPGCCNNCGSEDLKEDKEALFDHMGDRAFHKQHED